MKMNKKILIAIMTIIAGVALIGANVFADGGPRRDNIKSKGIIDYANGTVVINASDLTDLADEIDALESAYKKNTLTALNSVGTYFKTDGTYTHTQEEGAITSEYAENLSFSNLFEGILQSQSVDHLADAQAQDAEGHLLYYADESASESHNLIMTTTVANEFPILIQPADINNLTAGTAAWVNGTLIIGNGTDNQAYYNQGYADGFSEHQSSNARIEYVYHKHNNCPTSTYRCPGQVNHNVSHTYDRPDECAPYVDSSSGYWTGPCDHCGRTSYSPGYGKAQCSWPMTTYACGKIEDVTIESATLYFD